MTDTTRQFAPQSPLTPGVLALENAAPLDAVTRAADGISEKVTANPTVAAALKGAWLGHAVHPLLVEVPMGTWMSALALDVLGGEQEQHAAQLLTALGVLSAVPTALTGWAEYDGSSRRDKRVGVVHAGANGAAMVLQVGSWVARATGRHALGRALGAGGMTLAGVGGYLGGHLATGRKVGSRDVAFEEHPAPLV